MKLSTKTVQIIILEYSNEMPKMLDQKLRFQKLFNIRGEPLPL